MKRRTTTLIAAGLLALALFGALFYLFGSAGPLEDGVAAYQEGDYATAMSYWRPLADQGNAEAQASLGMMYLKGQGVSQDDARRRLRGCARLPITVMPGRRTIWL